MNAYIVIFLLTLSSLCAAVCVLYNATTLEGVCDQLLQAVYQMTAAFVFVALLGSALGEDLIAKLPTVLGSWYTEQSRVCVHCQNEAVLSDRIPTRDTPGFALTNSSAATSGVEVFVCAGARDAASFVGAPSAGGDLASAPAPGSPAPAADTLFTLSAAGMVLAADSLKLTSVATTMLFTTTGSKAGVYTTGQAHD